MMNKKKKYRKIYKTFHLELTTVVQFIPLTNFVPEIMQNHLTLLLF